MIPENQRLCFSLVLCSMSAGLTVPSGGRLPIDLMFLPLSPRFALVCVGSEASSRKLLELLPKRELHGQNPLVTPCNKQSLSQFEMQSRKSMSCPYLDPSSSASGVKTDLPSIC